MSEKSNFQQATYELFGIGSGRDNEQNKERKNENEGTKVPHLTVSRATQEFSPQGNRCYIAPNSIFEGNLRTESDVEIAGEFHGDINSAGKVLLRTNIKGNITANELELVDCKLTGDIKVNTRFVVGAESSVKGKVFAQAMECSGTIDGDVFVEKGLALKATAEIKGNIHTATMTMESGAKVYGNIDMKGTTIKTEKFGDEKTCGVQK